MTQTQNDYHTDPNQLHEFTVESIEDELKTAWGELAAHAEETSTDAPLRTSILTLVVVALGADDTKRARTTLHNLVRVLPSRAILLSIHADAPDLQAHVSAHCAYSRGGQASCYELIEIESNPHRLRAIPSIVTQLEIPDLPTFIWWTGAADIQSTEFSRLSDVAQRIIIDSARFNRPLETMRHYASFLGRTSPGLAGTDLTWGRLTTWRELLAQSFDMPAAHEVLANLQRVDMTFDPGYEADALLMAGWLTSRLGWEPDDASRSRETITFEACDLNRRKVRFNLSQIAGAGIGLRSVRLMAHTDQQSSRVTVRHIDPLRASVIVDVTAFPRQERIVKCADQTDHQVLGTELQQFSRDRIYQEALDHAARFATMLEREEVTR